MKMEFNPTDLQKKIANIICFHSRCIIRADCGIGKTSAMLMAIKHLLKTKTITKVLICAPISVAQIVWPGELEQWEIFEEISCKVFAGSTVTEEIALPDTEISIVNYEQLSKIKKLIRKKVIYDMIIFDEISYLKSAGSERMDGAKNLADVARRVIGLTATPLSKSYLDLWCPVRVVDHGLRLGKAFYRYRDSYFKETRPKSFKFTITEGSKEIIQKKIKDLFFSFSSKNWESKEFKTYVSLPPEVMKLHNDIRKNYCSNWHGSQIIALSTAQLLNKLEQITGGSVIAEGRWTQLNRASIFLHDKKLEALAKICDAYISTGESGVLVAYRYMDEADMIQEYLGDRFGKVVVYTSLPAKKRKEVVDQWNNREIQIILAHPKSASHGLCLQWGGHVVVWYGLAITWEEYKQYNGRLMRPGQKEKVLIYNLLAKDSIDELSFDRIITRKNTAEEFLKYLHSSAPRRTLI